ncbi:polysaccharide deacetylase family protein [Cohnella boryungensis]|uniref:Polysaccharide deacetylase family protein n=1 Tax=Cohnella boryungensis TaxID=768479 RepID=A0ABV8SAX1_9BACL
MRGKRLKFKRLRWSRASLLLLSAVLVGGAFVYTWQHIGLSGAHVADAATPEAVVSKPDSTGSTATPAESALPAVKPGKTTSAKPPASQQGGTASEKPVESKPSSPTAPVKDVHRKLVALTFDDGPDHKYTERILDILKEHDVKATFFLVGTQVKKYPKTAKRIAEEGHSIGNHTWSHGNLTKLSAKARAEQIDKAQKEIVKATGTTPRILRAPYGAVSDAVLKSVHKGNMKHVAWTVDTKDWAGSSVEDMYKNVMTNTKEGGIILMHSFGGRKDALEHTVKLLPLVIRDLQAKGYELVTVDEMVDSEQYRSSVIK